MSTNWVCDSLVIKDQGGIMLVTYANKLIDHIHFFLEIKR
jgi:hypothetical protein